MEKVHRMDGHGYCYDTTLKILYFLRNALGGSNLV